MTYLHGICKKEFKKMMQPFEDMPYALPEEEYGFNVGDVVYVHLKDICEWYEHVNAHTYYVWINHKKFELNRREIEELVDIRYEYKTYNSCVKDGLACANLKGFNEGENSRSRQTSSSHCSIHWEVGRGICSGFQD